MNNTLNKVRSIIDNVSMANESKAKWVMSADTLLELASELSTTPYMKWNWKTGNATEEGVLEYNPASIYGIPVEVRRDVTEPRLEIHGR